MMSYGRYRTKTRFAKIWHFREHNQGQQNSKANKIYTENFKARNTLVPHPTVKKAHIFPNNHSLKKLHLRGIFKLQEIFFLQI